MSIQYTDIENWAFSDFIHTKKEIARPHPSHPPSVYVSCMIHKLIRRLLSGIRGDKVLI